MHPSSMENMYKCYQRYVVSSEINEAHMSVLDVGGADVNGSYRDIFSENRFSYQSADTDHASNPDICLPDNYSLPIEQESFDIVLCGQTLEHCEYFWLLFEEMVRVLKPNGMLFLIVPSSGPIHRFPVDCYRFYPDFLASMAKYSKCYLIDFWSDQRGPWRDLTGVFSKSNIPQFDPLEGVPKVICGTDYEKHIGLTRSWRAESRFEEDITAGTEECINTLKRVHQKLQPELYLEIGIRHGRSLQISNCKSIAIDPAPELPEKLCDLYRVFEMTSDHFFEFHADTELSEQKIDLAFIDGMHLFEFALRDFINIEKYTLSHSLIAIDDVLPNSMDQASRQRKSRVWTGDVWKIIPVIMKYRPELKLKILDCHPAGLLLVSGLDSTNKVLENNYNQIVRQSEKYLLADHTELILARNCALNPRDIEFTKL